jgi:hypothetical protein
MESVAEWLTGGLPLLPVSIPLVVQRREWAAGQIVPW